MRSYVTILAVALCATLSLPAANAQTVFMNGGSVFNETDGLGAARGNYSSLQIGARTWLSRHFELQSSVTIVSEPSIDAGLRFRPMRSRTVEPYAFGGFGFLFASDDFRSVVPLGVGVQYNIDQQWSVHAEGAGMWTLARDDNGATNTIFGVSPNLGVSYKLNKGIFNRNRNRLAQSEADDSTNNTSEEKVQVKKPTVEKSTPKTVMPSTGTRNVRKAVIEEEMTVVPDGMFIMGLADEDPLSLQTAGFKRITVSSFKIDRAEVSNKEYREFLNTKGGADLTAMLPDSTIWDEAGFRFSWTSYFRGVRYDDHPVVGLTFPQAAAYCEAQGKRLPTEAEWEYAARSGREGGIYPWQGFEARNSKGEYMANFNNGRGGYAADGYAFTSPVVSYSPNEWGLYNMSGNVGEWVEDAYSATYLVLSDFNPYHIDEAEARRVVRGGSWASDEFYIGVGVRDAQPANEASPYVGARCAVDEATEELYRANALKTAKPADSQADGSEDDENNSDESSDDDSNE